VPESLVLLEDDRIPTAVDEHLWIDEARQWLHSILELERIRHGERVRMAGHGNQVLRPKHVGLFEDSATHLGQREAISRWIKSLQAAGCLDRLECHPSNALLFESEVHDAAELAVVEALLHGHDQCRGHIVRVETIECPPPYVAQVGAPESHEWIALEAVELQVDLDSWLVAGQ